MQGRRNDSTPERSERPPTIQDVAKRASVAISTVSARLNDTRPVAVATRSRIDEAMKELGYTPNSRARNLRRQRSGAVGLVLPDLLNPFFMEVATGLEQILRDHDVCVVICPTNFEADREAHYAALLAGRQLDGVVLLSGTGVFTDQLGHLASTAALVVVDEQLPGVDAPFVAADNRSGSRELARLALSLGHRRIAAIRGPDELWTARQRMLGIQDALTAHGLPTDIPSVAGDYRVESGAQAAKQLLDSDPPPSVILAANDLMALGCYHYAQQAGFLIGSQLSIAGFDDIPAAGHVAPGLTTVRQPSVELGRRAGAELLRVLGDLADDGADRESEALLPTELVVRGSLTVPGRLRP